MRAMLFMRPMAGLGKLVIKSDNKEISGAVSQATGEVRITE